MSQEIPSKSFPSFRPTPVKTGGEPESRKHKELDYRFRGNDEKMASTYSVHS